MFPGERVWITGVNGSGGMWLYVAGILNPDVLAPDVDSSVLVGFPFAEQIPGFRRPSDHDLRQGHRQPGQRGVQPARPRRPTRRTPAASKCPSRPTALVAQADAKSAFNTLFLGLGAVALLVGAIGVANIMVIAVLERRSEIGLRRALGATRGHIRIQFLTEAIALSLLGGVAGVIVGAAATAIYAHGKGWATVIPAEAWAGGLAAAIAHRRPRRAAARHPRRPPVPDPGPMEPLAHSVYPALGLSARGLSAPGLSARAARMATVSGGRTRA